MSRRTALAVLCCLLTPATTVGAAQTEKVTLTPAAGTSGTRIVVRGTGWAEIEFCKPRVVLAVNDVIFGRAVLDGQGRFAVRWRIPSFARGKHRIFATQHCESGKDGSP